MPFDLKAGRWLAALGDDLRDELRDPDRRLTRIESLAEREGACGTVVALDTLVVSGDVWTGSVT